MAVPASSLEAGRRSAAGARVDALLFAAPRPRRALAGGLARRIDRLARRAHAFHRFAHHPLCTHYAGELIQLSGRRRLCRGCCYALLASLVGLANGLLLPLPAAARVLGALFAYSAIAAGLAYARWARGRTLLLGRRASKLWTRALPAFFLTALLGSLLRTPSALDACLTALLIASCAALRAAYLRRGPDRTPCTVCPEREHAPCSGYRPIVRAERAFARRAGRLIDESLPGASTPNTKPPRGRSESASGEASRVRSVAAPAGDTGRCGAPASGEASHLRSAPAPSEDLVGRSVTARARVRAGER